MSTIARIYDPAKNPEGGALPGVPLRDLTDDEFAALPAWLQASVDALPCYCVPTMTQQEVADGSR